MQDALKKILETTAANYGIDFRGREASQPQATQLVAG